jgi:hypothetical protein
MNQFPAEVSLYKFVVNPVSADSFMAIAACNAE